MDAQGPARRLQHVDDRRRPRQGRDGGVGEDDAPHLLGRRRVRAQRNDDHRAQRQHVRGGDGAVENHEVDRFIDRVAHHRGQVRQRRPPAHGATDGRADGNHAAREVVERGPAMDPGTLSGEGPQKRRRDRVRLGERVQEQEDRGRGGYLPG